MNKILSGGLARCSVLKITAATASLGAAKIFLEDEVLDFPIARPRHRLVEAA